MGKKRYSVKVPGQSLEDTVFALQAPSVTEAGALVFRDPGLGTQPWLMYSPHGWIRCTADDTEVS